MNRKEKIIDYQKSIDKEYKKKIQLRQLHPLLINPTRTAIKDWLQNQLNKNLFDRVDLQIVNVYVGAGSIDSKILYDKVHDKLNSFQTISNHLRKDNITSTVLKDLNLIALIVGYHKRPYSVFEQDDFPILNKNTPYDLILTLKERILNEYRGNQNFNSISINGDRNKILGTLPMSKYYIQLSYLDNCDINNVDTLNQMERENSLSKSKHRMTDLSQGYFAENVLKSNEIIITGNPGVGKSTLAKWICYESVNKSTKPEKLFIYIQLRFLDFSQKDPLLSYVEQNYWKGNLHKFSHITQFLENIGEYSLILDGFDELDSDRALILTNIVWQLELNFIILSRPYGLLNLGKIQYDQLFQIDGFNTKSIKQYIRQILNKKKDKQPQELLKFIDDNKILYEYAHSPLMLSYIVLIYVTSKSPEEDLALIKSKFSLMEKVYLWILDHTDIKGRPNIDNSEKMKNKMYSFSLEMLLDKRYISELSSDEENFLVAKNISALGLGTMKKLDFKWIFSFDTVTFQEFFAVLYYKDRYIIEKAFIYLLNYPFFWNFGFLYFGMLSQDKQYKPRLLAIIKQIRYKRNDKIKNYFTYLYIMLISECEPDLLNELLTKNDFIKVISLYESVYYDSFWNTTNFEYTKKLFYKATQENKNVIINEFIKEINSYDVLLQNKDYNFWVDIFYIISEDNKQSVCNAIINKLKEVIELFSKLRDPFIEESKDENEKDFYLDCKNTIHFLFRYIYHFPKYILNNSKGSILKLLDSYQHNSKYIFINLQSHLEYNEIDDLLIKTHYENLKKLIRNLDSSIDTQLNLLEELVYSQKKTFKILRHSQKYIDKKYYVSNLVHLTNWILNNDIFLNEKLKKVLGTERYGDVIERYDYMLEILVKNLIYLNEPKIYDLIFDFAHYTDVKSVDTPYNIKAFKKYLDNKINNALKKNTNIDELKKLVYILKSSFLIQECFTEYEPKIFNLFKRINEYYHENFIKKKLIDDEELKLSLEITMLLLHSIYKGLHNKKHFINKLNQFANQESEFIIKDIILFRCYGDIVFYENKYWIDFWSVLKNNSVTALETIAIIANGSMYTFPSNRPHLFKIFINYFDISQRKIREVLVEEYDFDLFVGMMYLLFHLDNAPSYIQKQEVFKKVSDLLLDKEIVEYFKEYIYDDSRTAEGYLAYILLYYYKRDNKNPLLKYDIEKNLHLEDDVLDTVIDTILKFCKGEEKRLNFDKLLFFKEILGEPLYSKTLEVGKRRVEENEKFNHNKFKSLNKFKLKETIIWTLSKIFYKWHRQI